MISIGCDPHTVVCWKTLILPYLSQDYLSSLLRGGLSVQKHNRRPPRQEGFAFRKDPNATSALFYSGDVRLAGEDDEEFY